MSNASAEQESGWYDPSGRIEQFLEKNGTLIYANTGRSMLPLLREGKDLFTVKKKGEERCRKLDVVLYKTSQSRYVLHRIIKVRENDYVILGDNCVNIEYGITDRDILGVMTAYTRGKKTKSTDSFSYRVYSVVWNAWRPLRRFLKKIKRRFGKALR